MCWVGDLPRQGPSGRLGALRGCQVAGAVEYRTLAVQFLARCIAVINGEVNYLKNTPVSALNT